MWLSWGDRLVRRFGLGRGDDDGRRNCRRLGIAASRNLNSRFDRNFLHGGGGMFHLGEVRLDVDDADGLALRTCGTDVGHGPDVQGAEQPEFERAADFHWYFLQRAQSG